MKVSNNKIGMQFSISTKAKSNPNTKNVYTSPSSFQMMTPSNSRFRMYTAMNDILYSQSGDGCSKCGTKKH